MGYLEKEFLLHQRNDSGKLISIDYPIPELDKKLVLIRPAIRGEILELLNKVRVHTKENKDTRYLWEQFVIDHLEKPKLTAEELTESKQILIPVKGANGNTIKEADGTTQYKNKDIVDIFVDAIYAVSGIKTGKEAEEELKKK